jgi:alpha-beta hydrolase superfamily lysophospholipase
MTTWAFARQDPLAVVKTNLFADLRYYLPVLKKQLFSDELPEAQREAYFSRLETNESYRVNVDLSLLNLPKPKLVKAPILVMGAANDQVITREQVEVTARAYGTVPEIFSGMAHSMMLEKDWRSVADRMIAWLSERCG